MTQLDQLFDADRAHFMHPSTHATTTRAGRSPAES